jgi:hypothetical protein
MLLLLLDIFFSNKKKTEIQFHAGVSWLFKTKTNNCKTKEIAKIKVGLEFHFFND